MIMTTPPIDHSTAFARSNSNLIPSARDGSKVNGYKWKKKKYSTFQAEQVKLLEKSVQELDRTVDVLENKVDILGEEAERQRLHREELEIELDSLKYQIHNLKSADSDIKSTWRKKGKIYRRP